MNDFKILLKYWDTAFQYDVDEIDSDYKDLAPSLKMYEALKKLSKQKKILDYGCGNGFASIIMAKEGNTNIKAVDMAPNAIKLASNLALKYDINHINFEVIDESFLNHTNEKYDGIFCSNVLDVVPKEISKSILEYFYKITHEDSIVVIGLNYYLDLSEYKSTDRTKIKDNYFYADDVLRLVSLKDEEWESYFSPWFKVMELKHFSWPGETDEKRRLFILKRK